MSDLIRPSGTTVFVISEPSSELLGYFQKSLRDKSLAANRPLKFLKNPEN
jgi:hypothetical protein